MTKEPLSHSVRPSFCWGWVEPARSYHFTTFLLYYSQPQIKVLRFLALWSKLNLLFVFPNITNIHNCEVVSPTWEMRKCTRLPMCYETVQQLHYEMQSRRPRWHCQQSNANLCGKWPSCHLSCKWAVSALISINTQVFTLLNIFSKSLPMIPNFINRWSAWTSAIICSVEWKIITEKSGSTSSVIDIPGTAREKLHFCLIFHFLKSSDWSFYYDIESVTAEWYEGTLW